ncbi:MAG: hypothetical protein HOP19_18870 [Acidobacteria bacterium]|nr:hypothetical protein [Acidobacteriota bacterium]
MKDWTSIRTRYLEDSLPIRLGGLAANLSRIKSFSTREENRAAVESLIDESKQFIEWTAVEAEIHVAAELVELQLLLARWHYKFESIWQQKQQLEQMALDSQHWSKRVLELSGLLRA